MPLSRPSPSTSVSAGARRRLGVTAVELLVVVAVTGALVVTLIPAVTAARDQAVEASCLSNQRSLAVGWARYIQDYHALPGENYQEGTYWAGPAGQGAFYGGVQTWMATGTDF